MIEKIIFHKTGNFWIDNGIVMLYKKMLEFYDNIELEPDKLIVKSDNSIDEIINALNEAKKRLTKSYLGKTKNYGWFLSLNLIS